MSNVLLNNTVSNSDANELLEFTMLSQSRQFSEQGHTKLQSLYLPLHIPALPQGQISSSRLYNILADSCSWATHASKPLSNLDQGGFGLTMAASCLFCIGLTSLTGQGHELKSLARLITCPACQSYHFWQI